MGSEIQKMSEAEIRHEIFVLDRRADFDLSAPGDFSRRWFLGRELETRATTRRAQQQELERAVQAAVETIRTAANCPAPLTNHERFVASSFTDSFAA